MPTLHTRPSDSPRPNPAVTTPLTLQRQRLLQHAGSVMSGDPSVVEPGDLARLSQTLMAALELLKVADEELGQERRTSATIQAAQDRRIAHLEALFDLAPSALLLTSPDTAIRELNAAAARLFGVDAYSLTGEQLVEMIPGEDRPGFRHRLATAIEIGGVDAWSFTLKLRRSAPTTVCATVHVIDDVVVAARALYWHIRSTAG